MQDYRMLKLIKDTYINDLEIVTISTDENYSVFCSFLERNKDYNWVFLYAEDEDIFIDNYNIKAPPTYFLLDPDGKVAIDPTKTPEQGFMSQFGQIMNWKKRVEDAEKINRGFNIYDNKY